MPSHAETAKTAGAAITGSQMAYIASLRKGDATIRFNEEKAAAEFVALQSPAFAVRNGDDEILMPLVSTF